MTVARERENVEIFERWKTWVTAECHRRFNGRGEAVYDKFAEIFLDRNRLPFPSKSFINKLIAEAEREVARKIKPRSTISIDDADRPFELMEDEINEEYIVEIIDRRLRMRNIECMCGPGTVRIVGLLIEKYTISEICQITKIRKKEIRETLRALVQDQEEELPA